MPLYHRFIVLLFLSSSIAFAQTTSAAPASIPSQQEISELKVKAESGDPKAQVKLGQFYEDGTGLPVNHAAAVNWYRRAAEQKDPAAENNLGIMYRLGQGVDKDLKESVQWFRKAARQGYPNGCFNLGTAYYNGDGVPPNVTRAYAWFAIAKHLGSPSAADAVGRLGEELGKGSLSDAYVQTGRLLEAGEEVPQDLVEAAAWYRKAADASDPTGQWKLAALYSAGRGVPKDPAMGAMWRAKVLKSPQPEFMVEYGNMLRTGTDVPQDLKAAVDWYRKAAALGSSAALLNLGLMYAQGLGVPRDPVNAYVMIVGAGLGKEVGRGDVRTTASTALLELEKQMSPVEIEKARKEAKKRWPGLAFRTGAKQ